MMRGDFVFVRDAWGRPLVRRVCEVSYYGDIVYICNPERYALMVKAPDSTFEPTGWPVEDVFVYDPTLQEVLFETYEIDPAVWGQLTPYSQRSDRAASEREAT